MSILELKETYNKLIDREKRAEIFFNNPSIEQSKQEAWIPEYLEITKGLSLLMIEYQKITGEEMTDTEILNGFH